MSQESCMTWAAIRRVHVTDSDTMIDLSLRIQIEHIYFVDLNFWERMAIIEQVREQVLMTRDCLLHAVDLFDRSYHYILL